MVRSDGFSRPVVRRRLKSPLRTWEVTALVDAVQREGLAGLLDLDVVEEQVADEMGSGEGVLL